MSYENVKMGAPPAGDTLLELYNLIGAKAPAGYGLGTTAIAFTGSWNAQVLNGYYKNTTVGQDGAPDAVNNWLLHVIAWNAVYVSQVATVVGSQKMMQRSCMNGIWSAWKQIATTDLCAPSGYGLGNASRISYNSSIKQFLGNGFFGGYNFQDSPSGSGWIQGISISNGGDIITQITHDVYQGKGLATRYSSDFGNYFQPWRYVAYTDSPIFTGGISLNNETASASSGISIQETSSGSYYGCRMVHSTNATLGLDCYDGGWKRIITGLSNGNVGLGGVTDPKASLHGGGSTILGCQAGIQWSQIGNNQIAIQVVGSGLTFSWKDLSGVQHGYSVTATS